MPSPAEPHSYISGQTPLTAGALDRLDAQLAEAEAHHTHASTRKHAVTKANLEGHLLSTSPSREVPESNKANASLESEISEDSSASHNRSLLPAARSPPPRHPSANASATPPLMTDYIVDGTIYRSPDTLHTLITIAPTPAKGLAVFALRDVPPHTLLLSERPLVALNDDGARADPLDGLVNALSPPLKRAYRALHAYSAAPKGSGRRESLNRRVLYSNGFAIERTTTAVFEIASRINHSCVPNARFRWDAEAGRMDYYAVRKVLEGEEICIDYGHTKGRLMKYYGFECACGGCTEWGSVTSHGPSETLGEDGTEGRDAEVRLVQADGLWRPVEVAEIAAAVKEEKADALRCSTGGGEADEHEKENLRPEG